MKQFITFVVSMFIIVSCVTTPLWTNIGRNGVYVNICNDTLNIENFNSMMTLRGIDYHKWPKGVHVGTVDTITQYTYIKGDTTFNVTFSTAHKNDCIYNIRVFNELPTENDKK